jgi:hypothetical protein
MTVADGQIYVGDEVTGSPLPGQTYPVAIRTISSKAHQVVLVADESGAILSLGSTKQVTSITSGRKVVSSAGTAEPLVAASTSCKKVDIQAETDNTGVIAVGDSAVIASAATRTGVALAKGQFYSIEIDDAAKIYLDTTVNGDGVTYNISVT